MSEACACESPTCYECGARRCALAAARDEVIRAAEAWYGDGSRTRGPLLAETDALEVAVAKFQRLKG